MRLNFYQYIKKTGLLLFTGMLCTAYTLTGQEPVTFSWDFGTLPNGSLVGSSSNSKGVAGDAAYGPGISTVGTSPFGFLSGTSGLAIAGSGFPATLATAIANGDYFSFTVSSSCSFVRLTGYSFWAQRNAGGGPANVAIRSSLDGFSSDLQTETISGSGAGEDGSFDLTVAPEQILEIRIYGYSAGNNAGTLRIDDMQLQGEVIGTCPCCATRWVGGDTWGPGGTVLPGGHGGIVACANSAETQSNISPNCRYYPDKFTISLGDCKDPNNPLNPITVNPPFTGQKVLWFNFDLRQRANKFDFQVVDNDDLAWAIYYSTVPTDTINGNGLSGDCDMISAMPLYCGINFNNWATEPFDVPVFHLPTNFYLVVWKRDATNSSNDGFSLNAFKARYGCGEYCSLELWGPDTLTCDVANGTYTVKQHLVGTSTNVSISAPGSLSIVTNPSPLVFGEAGTINEGYVIVTYYDGDDYEITFTSTPSSGSQGYCSDPITISGMAPVCCVPPVCTITGATLVCPSSVSPFCAPENAGPYLWEITGNGTTSDPLDGRCISVTAGTTCNTTYTVKLTLGAPGCTSSCSEIVTVNATGPVFDNCTTGTTDLGCNPQSLPACDPGITASNDCGPVPVNCIDGPITVNGCTRTQAFTYTATACGITSTCTRTYTWEVVTAPVFANCDNTIDLGCNPMTLPTCDNYASLTGGAVTAGNECGSVPVTCSAGTVVVNGCIRTQVFTFTATDCGLTSTCTRTYTWEVVTAPVFSGNCNTTHHLGCNPTLPTCANVFTVNFGGTLTASNECGPVTVTCSAGAVSQNGCTRTQVFTFTATDCGLTSTCTRTYIWTVDVTPPTFTFCPPGADLGCNPAGIPMPGDATATDACSIPTITSALGSIISNGCQRTQVRTYTATDGCGNTATCTQVFTWTYDVTPPVFTTVPANITVQCNAVPTTVGLALATDLCSGPVPVQYLGQTRVNGSCPDSYVLIRTWKATDGCGNTKTATQRITVRDTQAPIFSGVPANVTVQCNAVPAPVTPVAMDNCDAAVTITFTETRTNGACTDSYTLTRKWTAADNCGNTRTATQRITVVDNTKPVFTWVPPNTTLECCGDCNPKIPVETPSAVDNCDASVTITYLGEVCIYFECPANRQLRRTWRATDNCGNSTTAMQTIDIRDTQPPTFTYVPPSITIECNDPFPYQPGTPTATDVCDAQVQITFNGQTSAPGLCPQEYVVTRQWTAVDDCGNAVTATQTITVQDTEAPIFNNAPSDVTVMCGMVPPVPVVTATDNCDNDAPVMYLGEINNGPNCPYTITRTWATEDDCGNEALHVQVITVGPQGIGNPDPEGRVTNITPDILTARLIPNPAMDEVWVAFDVAKESETILRLYDTNGRMIQQQLFTAISGPNRYRLDLSDVAKGGMYTVQVIVADQRTSERLMILRN